MTKNFWETKEFKQQKREFDAVDKLTDHWHRQPAIVDDDYPEWRHGYESHLKDLVSALQKNGRIK